jgi:DNA-binding GntR family transcriptional regulator
MMSPTQIYEPTYRAIKQRLMAGSWPAGMRLEAARIAADLQVSASPVRDGLNRLAGERLIEARSREGFFVPHLHGQTLRDLLAVNLALLQAALIVDQFPSPAPQDDPPQPDHATRTAQVFRRIAMRSANAELIAMMDNLNDRLHHVRLIEEQIVPYPRSELDNINLDASAKELRVILRHYHRRRQRLASRLEQALPVV